MWKNLYNFNFALFFSCPAGIQFSDPDVTGGVESKMLTVFLLMVFFNYLCVQNFGIYTTRKVLLETFPTLLSTPKYFTYLHRILKLYCCWAELKVEDFFLWYKYTNSLVNVDSFYTNFQKSPIPQLTRETEIPSLTWISFSLY